MKNKDGILASLERFIGVVEALRGENGCPWDKAQTHGSLRMELIEEAYEASDAMRLYEETGRYDHLQEELGDVLLHVIMHGVIAEEEGIFTLGDIAEGIREKMIHRHPHVFGSKEYVEGEREKSWEELKAEEKNHFNERKDPLRQIPRDLPALIKSVKVIKKLDQSYNSRIEVNDSVGHLLLLAQSLGTMEEKERREGILASMLYHMANIAYQDKISLEKLLLDRMNTVIEAYEPDLTEK